VREALGEVAGALVMVEAWSWGSAKAPTASATMMAEYFILKVVV
jgi:hypothetical protein